MIKLRCEAGDNSFGIDRSRLVVEDDPRAAAALQDAVDLPKRFGGHAADDGPDSASRSLELPHHEQLVIVVVPDGLQLPFALGMDRPLGIVAVHDQHVVSDRVMQVTGEQYRESRFSDAAFLIADGNAYRGDVHNTVFKKFENSRFRIAILSNFAFLLHSEMHSFRNSYFVDILYSERGKEQF